MKPVLTDDETRAVHAWLARHEQEVVADIADYVGRESPSDDPGALAECLRWLENWLDDWRRFHIGYWTILIKADETELHNMGQM